MKFTRAAPASCRESALAMLARRAHTRLELQQKLRRKQFETDEIEAVLDRLAERGLVDDRKTASSIVRTQSARGRGRGRLASELSAKGVSREDSAAALDELDPAEEAANLARVLARKARSLSASLTPQARSKKLFDHLVRRGYSPGAVLAALRKKGEPADDEP
ncbi:MAG: regulatory protein RecX [Thermoanaerobaculia bacterium]